MEKRRFHSPEITQKILFIALAGGLALLASVLTMAFVEGGRLWGILLFILASGIELMALVRVITNVRCPQCSARITRVPEGYRCDGCQVLWTGGPSR